MKTPTGNPDPLRRMDTRVGKADLVDTKIEIIASYVRRCIL